MRRQAALLVAALLWSGCTSDGGAPGAPAPRGPGAPDATAMPISVPVVASELDDTFLDGMTLAAERLNDRGGVVGRPLELAIDRAAEGHPGGIPDRLRGALDAGPPAVLVVASATDVAEVRADIEAARTPVIVLGGDPYTGRQMHRYLFQGSVPVRWQARVLAGYLVEDRRADPVALLTGRGPEGRTVAATFDAAFAEEGASPPSTLPVGRPSPDAVAAAGRAEAAVVMLPPAALRRTVAAFGGLPDPPQLVLPPSAFARLDSAPRGTVVCAPYTWAGWADMLPRVSAFREAFAGRFGRPPSGLEQEGYDAVMAVAEALDRTGGRGGDALVRALEGFREETYSSVPVRLGPDDHVLAEESHLGLFAVADPAGAPPAEAFGEVPWRPIMRTFTTDGEKVNLLDRDKRIFFPFWRQKRPTPKYHRSEYGIVSTRRGRDRAI